MRWPRLYFLTFLESLFCRWFLESHIFLLVFGIPFCNRMCWKNELDCDLYILHQRAQGRVFLRLNSHLIFWQIVQMFTEGGYFSMYFSELLPKRKPKCLLQKNENGNICKIYDLHNDKLTSYGLRMSPLPNIPWLQTMTTNWRKNNEELQNLYPNCFGSLHFKYKPIANAAKC